MSRPLRTQEGKKRYKRKLLILWVFSFFTFGTVIGMLAWLSFLPSLTISNVEITGNETILTDTIRDKTFALLSGRYYFLFSHSNAFLYPRKKITGKLSSDLPRAENIAISLKGLNTLAITIRERKAAYLFCKDEGENECYFLDKTGYVFDIAPSFSGDAYVIFVRQNATTTPVASSSPIGTAFLDQSVFNSLISLANDISKLGFTVQKIILGDDKYSELIFREGWTMKFSTDQETAKLVNNLNSLMKVEKWKKAMRGGTVETGKLLYLDFRFGNKIYYKFDK